MKGDNDLDMFSSACCVFKYYVLCISLDIRVINVLTCWVGKEKN